MFQARSEFRVIAQVGDGLDAVQKAVLQPDLVVLDIGLPSLNGLEAAKRILQVAPHAKIIFLTTNSDRDVTRAALSAGEQGYVLKTNAARELLTAVQKVLGGENFVSSGIQTDNSGETE